MLELRGIDTFYGDSHVLHCLSLAVAKGECVAVLGKNGVGKTTLVRSIAGLSKPRNGEIYLDGENLAPLKTYQIIRRGVALVPQGRRMFNSLTVRETLQISAEVRRFDSEGRSWSFERVFAAFPRLKERLDTRTGWLSGGEQEMLAVARALVGSPRLLLLDEPSEGLSPLVVEQLGEIFTDLKREGATILMVEQRVAFALKLADRVLVMSKGAFVYEGTSDELLGNAEVRERYLGL
jgi:branched-chain amino acid transport system ATP-binding protein